VNVYHSTNRKDAPLAIAVCAKKRSNLLEHFGRFYIRVVETGCINEINVLPILLLDFIFVEGDVGRACNYQITE